MLSNEALEVLKQTTYSEFIAVLPGGQLERELYEEINDVLVRCGGKWSRGKKGHVFPYDPKPLIQAVVDTGQMPPKNPTAFFPTPRKLVEWMVEFSRLELFGDGTRILEPSGGTGGILDVIREKAAEFEYEWHVDTCEFLDINRSMLKTKGYNIVGEDFMQYRPDFEYDVILMNPPFSLESDSKAYITHVMHAWSMLRDGGQFAAIVPPGFQHNRDKKSRDFMRFVCEHLEWEECRTGEFKESGTGVNTFIIYGEKQEVGWRREPYNGWPSWMSWHASLLMDNTHKFYLGLQKVKGLEDFEKLCRETEQDLVRDGEAMWLTPQDIQALWKYYREHEEFIEHLDEAQDEPVKVVQVEVRDEDLGGLFAA